MKTQPLKGMRDLLPREQALRDYIQGQILDTYRAAGGLHPSGIGTTVDTKLTAVVVTKPDVSGIRLKQHLQGIRFSV